LIIEAFSSLRNPAHLRAGDRPEILYGGRSLALSFNGQQICCLTLLGNRVFEVGLSPVAALQLGGSHDRGAAGTFLDTAG
jgi:hypothetical protein